MLPEKVSSLRNIYGILFDDVKKSNAKADMYGNAFVGPSRRTVLGTGANLSAAIA